MSLLSMQFPGSVYGSVKRKTASVGKSVKKGLAKLRPGSSVKRASHSKRRSSTPAPQDTQDSTGSPPKDSSHAEGASQGDDGLDSNSPEQGGDQGSNSVSKPPQSYLAFATGNMDQVPLEDSSPDYSRVVALAAAKEAKLAATKALLSDAPAPNPRSLISVAHRTSSKDLLASLSAPTDAPAMTVRPPSTAPSASSALSEREVLNSVASYSATKLVSMNKVHATSTEQDSKLTSVSRASPLDARRLTNTALAGSLLGTKAKAVRPPESDLAASGTRRPLKRPSQGRIEDRREAEKVLQRMHDRHMGYLRNPRFVPSMRPGLHAAPTSRGSKSLLPQAPPSPTPVPGALETNVILPATHTTTLVDVPPEVPGGAAPFTQAFAAAGWSVSPPELVIKDYKVGEPLSASLTITNSSTMSQRLRVLPPSSVHFTVSDPVWPASGHGRLAPGMSIKLKVTFTADSRANYQDQLVLQTEDGDVLVPLKAQRDPPALSLPSAIQCGDALVHETKFLNMDIANSGGPGSFTIMPSEQAYAIEEAHGETIWASWTPPALTEEEEEDANEAGLVMGPFKITPVRFQLKHGAQVPFQVAFTPDSETPFAASLAVHCDNGALFHFTVDGRGCVPTVVLTEFLGQPADSSTVYMPFSQTVPRASHSKSLVLENRTDVPLQFSWRAYRAPKPDEHPELFSTMTSSSDLAEYVVDAPEQEEAPFSVDPPLGVIPAMDSMEYTVTFNPHVSGTHEQILEFSTENIPRRPVSADSIYSDTSEGTKRAILATRVPVMYFLAQGMAGLCQLSVSPPAIQLDAGLTPGMNTSVPLVLTNPSAADVVASWDTSQLAPSVTAAVEPAQVVVPAQGSAQVTVSFVAEAVGQVFGDMLGVFGSVSYALPVSGVVSEPQMSLSPELIDCQLMAVGHSSSSQLLIQNNSLVDLCWSLTIPSSNKAHVTTERSWGDGDGLHGSVPAGGYDALKVNVKAISPGSLTVPLTFRMSPGGKEMTVSVRARIEDQQVKLATPILEVDKMFVGVPVSLSTSLVNPRGISAEWSIDLPSEGLAKKRGYELSVFPSSGVLSGKSQVDLSVSFTPLREGVVDLIVPVRVKDMDHPIGMLIKSTVNSIRIAFTLEDQPLLPGSAYPDSASPPTGSRQQFRGLVEGTQLPRVDFGSTPLPLNEVHEREVVIHNPTAISSKFSVTVATHPAAQEDNGGGCPSRRPLTGGHSVTASPSKLLASARRRSGTVRRSSMTPKAGTGLNLSSKWEATKRAQALNQPPRGQDAAPKRPIALQAGKGVAFSVFPESGLLAPFSTVVIKVQGLADSPGRYQDNIEVTVEGHESPFVLPVSMYARGEVLTLLHRTVGLSSAVPPATSLETAAVASSTLRAVKQEVRHPPPRVLSFQPTPLGAADVVKTLVFANSSPKPIAVSWEVFHAEEDSKLVELDWTLDQDGELQVALSGYNNTPMDPSAAPLVVDGPGVVPPYGEYKWRVALRPAAPGLSPGTLRAFLVPKIESVTENSEANDVDAALNGPDDADDADDVDLKPGLAALVGRQRGRINIMAPLVAPELRTEPKNHLRFIVPVCGSTPNRQVALTNDGGGRLGLRFRTEGPFNLVQGAGPVVLAPGDSTAVVLSQSVKFSSPLDGEGQDGVEHGALVMEYETGQVGRFPLEALVCYPELHLGPLSAGERTSHGVHVVDIGAVTVGSSRSFELELVNDTVSDAPWRVLTVKPALVSTSESSSVASEALDMMSLKSSLSVASQSASVVVNELNLTDVDRSQAVWIWDTPRGLIGGRAIGAKPKRQVVTVTFRPASAVDYGAVWRVSVGGSKSGRRQDEGRYRGIRGRAVEVVFRGIGTLEEEAEDL